MPKDEKSFPSAQEAARTIASSCIAQRARRLDRLLMSIYTDELRGFDLKVTQVTLLVAIHLNEPVQPADLAEGLDLERSTLSRNLSRMEARGWVRSKAQKEDGRASTVELTAKGRRLIERVFPLWREAQRKAEARFGAGTLDTLNALLTHD